MSPLVLGLAAAFLTAPLVVILAGVVRRRRDLRQPWDLRLTALSTLTYALAFNLTFLVQELGLVIPKALTPGLKPVLFHNNHDWAGDHPLAELFQGTGALATVLVGLGFAAWLARRPPRSEGLRLFAIWMALIGVLMALPQVLLGTMIPQNDVGRAMAFLGVPAAGKLAACVAALLAMAAACRWAAGQFAALGRGGPMFALQAAALPALVAIALIAPFRVPRSALEVLLPPVLTALVAVPWLLAWSFRAEPTTTRPTEQTPLWAPLAALAALLAFFQLVLRPGVPFY